MELPFAVTDDQSLSPPGNNDTNVNDSNQSLSHASSNTYQNVNPTTGPTMMHRGLSNTTNSSVTSNTSNTSNTSTLLHSVALYDNVHTEHFYTPRQFPATSTTTPSNYYNNTNESASSSSRLTPIHSLEESTFVTIGEGDTDGNLNGYSNILPSYNNTNHESHNQYVTREDAIATAIAIEAETGVGEYVSIGINSYKQRQQQQQQQKNTKQPLSISPSSFKRDTTVDILSLLISSCNDNPATPGGEQSETKVNHDGTTTTTNNNFVQLCEEASKAATEASKLTNQGDIPNAITKYMNSAKNYKDAAIFLKEHHGAELSLLAYSLLVLSNAQARTGNSLLKHCGGSSNSTGVNVMDAIPKINPNEMGRGNLKTANRLRAKIRASMNKAEADMTDSVFLSKDVSSSSSPMDASVNIMSHKTTATATNTTSNAIVTPQTTTQNEPALGTGIITTGRTPVNPVDDMMELEKELRYMDMTLEMGVGLGTSSSAANNNNNNGGGSFCVVPSGSSYMASSMMWSSGIGGRAQQPSAATALLQQQQQQISASVLASSTTSLSNSMVGIRSPNLNPQHNIHGSMAAPANREQQLVRLLDSMNTLRDENTNLIREVQEIQKVRLEARTAREAMKQFKEEYARRFTSLKAALEKFRNEYPDQHGDNGRNNGGGGNNHNIVAKSDFVQKKNMMELQKKDQLINKLNAELAKEKRELQKKDQLISKLNAELNKEKRESKKKDDALRKYENFYKEVKARSAQRAKQREEEQRKKSGKK